MKRRKQLGRNHRKRRAIYYSITFNSENPANDVQRHRVAIKRELHLSQLCQSIDSVQRYKSTTTDILVFVDEDVLSSLEHDQKWKHIKSIAKIIPFKLSERWKPGTEAWVPALATHKWFHFKSLFQDMKYDIALFLDQDTIATRNMEYIFYANHAASHMYICRDDWVTPDWQFLGRYCGFVQRMIKTKMIPYVINSGQFLVSKEMYNSHLHKLHKNDYQSYFECLEEVANMEKDYGQINKWFNEETAATLLFWKMNVPLRVFSTREFSVFFNGLPRGNKKKCPDCEPNSTIIHYGSKSLWMLHWKYWDKLKYMFQLTPAQMDNVRKVFCLCGDRDKHQLLHDTLTKEQHEFIGGDFYYKEGEWNPKNDSPFWAFRVPDAK